MCEGEGTVFSCSLCAAGAAGEVCGGWLAGALIRFAFIVSVGLCRVVLCCARACVGSAPQFFGAE